MLIARDDSARKPAGPASIRETARLRRRAPKDRSRSNTEPVQLRDSPTRLKSHMRPDVGTLLPMQFIARLAPDNGKWLLHWSVLLAGRAVAEGHVE